MALIPSPAARLIDRLTGRTRRVWATEGRAHLEYRPPDPADHPRLVRRLTEAVAEMDEVHAVSVNPHVRRVVVTYHDLWVTVDELVATVAAVEDELGLSNRPFPRDRTEHPADVEPFQRELLALATTALGMGTSVLGRLGARRRPTLPSDLSWLATLVDSVPPLRTRVERALGWQGADLLLAVATSLLRGISLGLTGHIVDAARRVTRLRQLTATMATWAEREPQLLDAPGLDAAARPERPEPLPDGPIERYAERSWTVSLGGFATGLVVTDDVERAAAPLLDGIPKAARLGRAAFCAQLGRVLAERAILVLDERALHLLDRVDLVVLDGSLLDDARTRGRGDEAVRFLRGLVSTGLPVLVSGNGADLPPSVTVIESRDTSPEIDRRQRDGTVVLAIGSTGAPAFPRADIRVGLQQPGAPAPWDADVLCTDELADALVLVRACVASRHNSEQAVTLATTGAGIGAATATGRLRPSSGHTVLRMIDTASMLTIGNGIRLAAGLSTFPGTLHEHQTPWHDMRPDTVLRELDARREGLTTRERQQRYTEPPARPGPLRRAARATGAELANPLTPVLGAGAAISLATGATTDAGLVGSVVALNAAIGAAQRLSADRVLRELTVSGTQQVTVRRDGVSAPVPAVELVVGDVVELAPGEAVPADARLLEARALEVDESSLTGESLPVCKSTRPVGAEAVADRTSMLYQGTVVAAGEAVAVVVATGMDTEARRAAAWVDETATTPRGVEARLEQLTQLTIPLALLSGAGVAVGGLLRHTPTRELLDAGVGLAVAAIPEGLPLLADAAQRSAARRLSRHRVLVREPRAIEALGRVDLLCADKTGTLTRGRLRLAVVSDGATSVEVAEAGDSHRHVLLAARRATPVDPRAERLPHPTDQAVAAGTADLGVRRETGGGFEILADLPFAPDRAYHAVLAATPEGRWLSVKGAPEEILARSSHLRDTDADEQPLTDGDRERLTAHATELARRGLRVLAVAERPVDRDGLDDADVVDLGFVGLLGLRDPVRPRSADSVAQLRDAGVDVMMITGDHPTTARSIAAELDLGDGALLTGPEIDALDDDELARALPDVSVFARVTPAHKVRIVQCAQALGRVVAMTGDGANDAPAIRLADVGIAVGTNGTSAARESADVVILDDRLEVIVEAIAEGRGLWGSVREAVAVLVGGNLGEITYTLAGSVVGKHPPLNTRQLLLVNLLTDVAPAMALAVRAPRAGLATRLAEGPDRSLGFELNRALVWRGAGGAIGATTTYVLTRPTGSPQRARTAGLVALVGTQLGQTALRAGGDPRVVLTGVATFAAMATAIQTPGVSHVVGCRPMGPVGWANGLGGAALGTFVGLVGPTLERRVAPGGGVSDRLVDRLAEMAPRIPGVFEPVPVDVAGTGTPVTTVC